jgi:hypothetical protein
MWVCPDCTHPIGDPCPQPPEHDAGLGGERQAEPAAREGRDDLRLTYEVYDNKHGLFEGNLLVAVVGECVARSEQARELAQTIKTRVNTHTQLVAALEQAHELVYVGVSDRKMLSRSNLYRVVDTIADALRQARGGEWRTMITNTEYEPDNPEPEVYGRWFKPAEYPDDVYVCPLCELPETTGIYEFECDCWNERDDSGR